MGHACSCSRDTFDSEVDLMDMLRMCDTGDIILFNNPMAATYIIKWATDSKWDHVGMILKYSDNPHETILIESAGCGVFICYAKERLQTILDDSNPSIIGWRQLAPRPSPPKNWKKMMHREAERLIDTPYEQNFSEFVKAWIGEDQTSKWILSHLGGTLKEGATKGEDLNSVFCSELAAHLLKHGHLLDPAFERDSNAYAPRDFATQSNAHLKLKMPYELKQERRVRTNIGAENYVTATKVGASPLDNPHNSSHSTVGDLIKTSSASREMYQRLELEMAIAATEAQMKSAKAANNAEGAAEAKKNLGDLQQRLDAMPKREKIP